MTSFDPFAEEGCIPEIDDREAAFRPKYPVGFFECEIRLRELVKEICRQHDMGTLVFYRERCRSTSADVHTTFKRSSREPPIEVAEHLV